jgi:hypothetical protein
MSKASEAADRSGSNVDLKVGEDSGTGFVLYELLMLPLKEMFHACGTKTGFFRLFCERKQVFLALGMHSRCPASGPETKAPAPSSTRPGWLRIG